MQTENRPIEENLCLVPYYPDFDTTLGWYQDAELCRQVDNIDRVYSKERLEAMYRFLSTHGECYYIRYQGILVGDVTLLSTGELAIVICKEYQNRKIGRKCVGEMIALAREKGLSQLTARIYAFNTQSRRMFRALGFEQDGPERYVLRL